MLRPERYSISAEKGFGMTERIYVRLLNEGLDVWRPAPAWKIGQRTYIVLRPETYEPDDEQWEFLPGSAVECDTRELSGGASLVATRAAELNRQTA